MTVPNPFVEFATDPVGVLAWAGYALLLVALAFASLRTVLRGIPTLVEQWRRNRHNTKVWFSIGSMDYGIVPPFKWSALMVLYLLVLAVFAWTAGALLWLLGV